MKLLVVTPYFYPKTGGVEEHTFNLYSRLAKKGYEISVVTSKYNSTVAEMEYLDGLTIYRLSYQLKISNSPFSLKWVSQIKKIIAVEKPDVIMAHSPVPLMADFAVSVAGGIPVILKYHSGSMKKENENFHNFLIRIYESLVLKTVIIKSDYLICTSDFVREIFLKEFKSKSSTVTPGVDLELFQPGKENSPGQRSILFVGRIDKNSKWKGIKYLIEAFALVHPRYPALRLSIVGDGDDLPRQKNFVRQLSLQDFVDFYGSLKGRDLVRKYQESTLLAVPSTTEAESFGMVLLEAMACKKPVIGSNIGGIPYVIDHGKDGLLVPPADTKSLARGIIRLLDHPEMARVMGEHGYSKVNQNYSWDRKAEATGELIEKVYQRRLNETYQA